MRIAIGADHAGYRLKQHLAEFLDRQGHEVVDFGTHSPERMDYPDVGLPLARAVAAREFERGILICGSGIGMSILANKVRGVRAALCTNCYMARLAREHNDAQILCLGERVVGVGLAEEIVRAFLSASFLGQQHAQRLGKIQDAEERR